MRALILIPSSDGMHIDVYDNQSNKKLKTYNLIDLYIGTKIDLMRELVKLMDVETPVPVAKRTIQFADQ